MKKNKMSFYKSLSNESYPNILMNQSYLSIIFTSPTFSSDNMEYKDQVLQCNLDIEFGKNFLMFDDDIYFNVLIPRRNKINRVYEIEDVACRLNCSTMQFKKFSKISQKLIAKNMTDTFAHAREVVDELRHLTKTLNFKQSEDKFKGSHTWYNINWGDNAPYWNQYYKVVREYNYPFEMKSDESRILDTVSEEINRLIDTEEFISMKDSQKIEVPIDHLMSVVKHITTDVDKVRDILEWNGYEVIDNAVIHSRLVFDGLSTNTQEEWTDVITDWGTTDVLSTSLSENSMNVPDYNDRPLRRVLDAKIQKLRSLLASDEDITTELDRVVCRLMKLALNLSRGRDDPPSTNWMQCKMFDLLTLTERAIEKRRRHFFTSYSMKAIEYYNETRTENMITRNEIKTDTAKNIVSKYFDLLSSSDFENNDIVLEDQMSDFDFEDSISTKTNNETEFDEIDNDHDYENFKNTIINEMESTLNIDTHNTEYINTESPKLCDVNNLDLVACCTEMSDRQYPSNDATNAINLNLRIFNENVQVKSKYLPIKAKLFKRKSKVIMRHKIKRRTVSNHKVMAITPQSTLSKPIPDSFINLCKHECQNEKDSQELLEHLKVDNINQFERIEKQFDVNNIITEDSLLLSIVTESCEEIVALRRDVGINPEINFEDNENVLSVIDITKNDSFVKIDVEPENTLSQTIFIYDINQPSTSKGYQRMSTDVQCGPDVSLTRVTISATTSLTALPNIFSNTLKIKETFSSELKRTTDSSTTTGVLNISPESSAKAIGIKIKDSDNGFITSNQCRLTTQLTAEDLNFISHTSLCDKDSKILKAPSSALQNKISSPRICSMINIKKSVSQLFISPNNTSDVQILSMTKNENIVVKKSQTNYIKQNLIHGGVHVHSFKEKVVSEDVVYQGEWQRKCSLQRKKTPDICHRSNLLSKKRKHSSVIHTENVNTITNFEIEQLNKCSLKPPVRKIKHNIGDKKIVKKMSNNKKNVITEKTYKTKLATIQTKVAPMTITSARRTKSAKSQQRNIPEKHSCSEIITQKKEESKFYIPTYLKRRIIKHSKAKNVLNDITHITTSNKLKTRNFTTTEGMPKDLNLFTERNKNYLVFRNENEIHAHSARKPLSVATGVVRCINRNMSPPSQNSSPCSSPNSVETVRAALGRTISNRRDSPSSERGSSGFENDMRTRLKNKSYSKRNTKANKKSPNRIICANKENVPESSMNSSNLESVVRKDSRCTQVTGKTTSAFYLQTKDNLKLQTTPKRSVRSMDKPIAKFCMKDTEENLDASLDFNNISFYYSNFDKNKNTQEHLPTRSSIKNIIPIDSTSTKNSSNAKSEEKIDKEIDSPKKSIHSTTSSIISAIRQLIEEKIYIAENNSHDSLVSGSETVILNRNDIYDSSFNKSSSPISVQTVIANDSQETTMESFLSFQSSDHHNIALLSSETIESQIINFDSVKPKDLSVSTPKFSEYYLADNELENVVLSQIEYVDNNSVHELFERKDRTSINTNINGLAIQAFSGFSISGSLVGDISNNINFVDSETECLTFDSARQAASEEVFVSGRSSDTYESCYFDDDTYVPSWLFDIISQQQSIDESEVEDDNLPVPLEDGIFDANGNVLEPEAVVRAGAGDGRGMHSDVSQDSSGRGSLSSSATSSGLNETDGGINSHAFATSNNETNQLNRRFEGNNANERNAIAGYSVLTNNIDADVSSYETDAVDSDN